MAWVEMGTLALTYEWRSFAQASVNGETFRVSMPDLNTVDGYCLIRPYYAISGVGKAQRFYPSEELKITTFLIPPELRERSEVVRYFQACLSRRARVFEGQSWKVKLEEFI